MKILLKLEELGMLVASIVALYVLDVHWAWYAVLAVVPDIGMAGYLAGNKIGAYSYNLFHHKGIAVLVGLTGWWLNNEYALLSGIALFGHSSMDRFFGFGLKTTEGFKFTHLGKIGKE